jgi:hypothetical protein
LDIADGAAGIALIPVSIEVLGDSSELHGEVAGEVFRADFSSLLSPEADESSFIIAHNDSGVRAADESPPIQSPGMPTLSHSRSSYYHF